MTARIAGAVALMASALVCGYLFLAGFEYPGVTMWKIVTGTFGVLFVACAIFVSRKRARP